MHVYGGDGVQALWKPGLHVAMCQVTVEMVKFLVMAGDPPGREGIVPLLADSCLGAFIYSGGWRNSKTASALSH